MLNTAFSTLVWFLAALTFALSIAAPNGYNVGATLVFLLSFGLFFLKPKWCDLSKEDKALFWVFALFGLSMFGFVYIDGWHTRELDKPSRFILVLPVMFLLLKSLGREQWLWFGCIVGAIGAFVLALYERQVLGLERAQGSEHPIMFGNAGMMLGFLSLTGAIYFFSEKRFFWLCFAVIGGMCGIGASVLSGSRGGWVGFPIIGLFMFWQCRDLLDRKLLIGVFSTAILAVVIVIAVPQTGIQHRVSQAIHNIETYVDGSDKETSVGARFDMWKAAWYMFKQDPILGVGGSQLLPLKTKYAAQGLISMESVSYGHAHNEYLDALSKRGLLGLVFLLCVYLVPLRFFMKKLRQYQTNWRVRPYAIGGALIPLCYIDFALTQVMFAHNIGVMMYAFPIVYFWAAVRWAERKELAK